MSGDAEGNLIKLFTQVENQQNRVGKFDVLFTVGAFLPGTGPGAKEASANLVEYVGGKRKAPVETYFIESRSAALLQAAPEGKVLCEGVHFLGGFGIKEIKGLRVAYLSGRYDLGAWEANPAGTPGPAFVGAAYTPRAIEQLKSMASECGGAIDLLLTAEWPTGLQEKLDDPERPKHPEGLPLKMEEFTASPIAELCAALEPRYHVFGSGDIFYQRPPFQTRNAGHVSRCIGLGKVGSKGKGRTWVHGLSLSPAAVMPETALKQRPPNTTPNPFLMASMFANAQAPNLKRSSDDMEGNAGGEGAEEVVPDQVFLGRLPPNIEDRRIEAALKHIGKIERVHLARDEGADGKPCKGFGWVTFSTPEEAQAACEMSELFEVGGRKITITMSKRKEGAPKKKREITIVIEPHADCWFCLVNPQVEKHMIVSATTAAYIATARGPIKGDHVMVLPVKHAPCYAACPPELQTQIQAQVQAIREMCRAGGQDVIVWERWIPMGMSAANHMQIQIVPIDSSRANNAHEALEEMVKKNLPGAKMKRIKDQADVVDHLNDDSTTPYIYFELPGDNTAKGRMIERFVYAGVAGGGGPRIPINFGRQVACRLLGCDEKVDWRQCQDDRDTEKVLAATFREQFKPFQPKKK